MEQKREMAEGKRKQVFFGGGRMQLRSNLLGENKGEQRFTVFEGAG